VRVIGRRKARSSPPAEDQNPAPEGAERELDQEASEWDVSGPTVSDGGEPVEGEPREPEEASTSEQTRSSAPFDQAAIDAPAPVTALVNQERDGATGAPATGEAPLGAEPVPAEEQDNVPAASESTAEVQVTGTPSHEDAEDKAPVPAPEDPSSSAPSTSSRRASPAPKAPKHASSEEDPVSSVLDGPGPQGQRTLPRVMAVANQKGGVGKTTTTVNLGAALAELGYRVLVIDLDPQGNATTGLGIDARNFERSMYDVIMHETPMEDCIEPTSVRNLFVAPATIDLAGVEIELVPAFSRELRLRKAIERIVDDFDFVMIDCPPSLGLITVNGLAAASEVLVPIQCEYYALEGLSQLLRNVHLVASNLNEDLEVSAIVLTMYDGRTRLAIDVAAEVREHFQDKVCRNVIPRTIRLSEAPSFGQPITVFDPTSRGAIAYRELAKEVSNGAPKRAG
jgi:chromosome partitioning protein